jgi:hypothetical protein
LSDDTRAALGIPTSVHTSLGPIEVRTLSAIEFVVFSQQLVGIAKIVVAEPGFKDDFWGAIQSVLVKHPLSVVGLLGGATGKTAEEIGSLPIDEYVEVALVFVDHHEKAIKRFFEGKRRMEELTARVRPSPNSSTRSSRAAGRSPTSEPLATTNSKNTADSPPSDPLSVASS